MRILIDISEGRDDSNRKAVKVRTSYFFNSDDCLRVRNCGTEIYNAIREGFDERMIGGVVSHEGERR